jgi:hypothetical protein
MAFKRTAVRYPASTKQLSGGRLSSALGPSTRHTQLMRELDSQVRDTLKQRALAIESALDGDVIYYYGPIFP